MTAKHMRSCLTAGAMLVAVLAPDITLAQTSGPSKAQTPPPAEAPDCATPADPSKKGDRVPKQGEELSDTLRNCNGVLKAPEAGDKGIVTPAPDTGNSRVIKPRDVPENANPSNGSGG